MLKKEDKFKDEVFAQSLSTIPEFQFDERVTQVFEDMIKRSVPGYELLVYLIGLYAQVFSKNNTRVYDLGSSTGVVTCVIASIVAQRNIEIIAVDSSVAMIEQSEVNIKKIESKTPVTFICDEVQNIEIKNTSMVVLNFTLQFIAPDDRIELLQNIYNGLEDGGVLVLSEKVVFSDNTINNNMIELHQAFKKTQGYSELEISQKRTSLENILIPDTNEEHLSRLKAVGFSQVMMCFQCFNFVSFLAIK